MRRKPGKSKGSLDGKFYEVSLHLYGLDQWCAQRFEQIMRKGKDPTAECKEWDKVAFPEHGPSYRAGFHMVSEGDRGLFPPNRLTRSNSGGQICIPAGCSRTMHPRGESNCPIKANKGFAQSFNLS